MVVFILSLVGGLLLTMLGLWGNWIILSTAVGYILLISPEFKIQFGWWLPGVILALALLGELIEFMAAAMGAKKAGASRRATALSLVGSLIGAIFGFPLGSMFLPIIGGCIGSLLLGGVGALLGTMLGEKWKGKKLSESFESGQGAFWGRLLGTLGKSMTATAIVFVSVIALIF